MTFIKFIQQNVSIVRTKKVQYFFYRFVVDKRATRTQISEEVKYFFDLDKVEKINILNRPYKLIRTKFGYLKKRKSEKIAIVKTTQVIDIHDLFSKYGDIIVDTKKIEEMNNE